VPSLPRRSTPRARPFAGLSKGQPFYKTTAWRVLRKAVIEAQPLCVLCGQRPSVVADHRVPRRMGGSDTPDNLQGACWPCSRTKTAHEANAYRRMRAAS
jgi:5-methylcytosine-specific restriction endonuclease McrA